MRELGRYGVEGYLRRQVKKAGGLCEKFVSPGKKNVPDDLVTWGPGSVRYGDQVTNGFMDLIETKATGKKPRRGQLRDHKRRRELGIRVFVLDTKQKVDDYIRLRTQIGELT